MMSPPGAAISRLSLRAGGAPHQREGVVEAATRLRWEREPGAPV